MKKTNIKALRLKSLWKKSFGLMFDREIHPVYFETRYGVHTFFLKKSIDILILDKNYKVKYLKKGIKPWKIFIWNPKFKKVLELPEHFIDNNLIKLGSKIKIT